MLLAQQTGYCMERKVVIICSANMCRSPMASGYLRKRLAELGEHAVEVESAAIYYDGGARATEGARQTAIKNNFDLENHRSQFLDDSLYKWADEILVMTAAHKHDLQLRFPTTAHSKVFMLGSFEPGHEEKADKDVEVMDPYGSATSTYETVFAQIQRSLDGWLQQRLSSSSK